MNTEELIKTACSLFGEPYDDRESPTSLFSSPHGQKPEHTSLRSVAEEMEISTVKVRKLLISGGFYSTVTSRRVQELYDKARAAYLEKGECAAQAEKFAVINATDYWVSVMKNGECSFSYQVENNSFNLYGFIQEDPTAIWTFSVRAFSSEAKYADSDTSSASDPYKGNFDSIIKLSVPTGLTWEGKVAKWNGVDNASKYYTQLYHDGKNAGYATTNTNSYDWSAKISESGNWTFSVVAAPDDAQVGVKYEESSLSAQSDAYVVNAEAKSALTAEPDSETTVETKALNAVTELKFTEQRAEWTAVENAVSYKVVVMKDGEEILDTITSDSSVSIDLSTAGTYKISVIAVGDEEMFTDSAVADAEKVVESAKTESSDNTISDTTSEETDEAATTGTEEVLEITPEIDQ